MTLTSLEYLKDILGQSKAVGFKEFVSSPDYCNNPNIYNYWYEQTSKEGFFSLSEVIFDGSLGGGKTTVGAYVYVYRHYLLFNGGSPQLQLGLSENSDIYGLYFSVSMKMAMKSGFRLLYSIFKECKWFQDNCPIDTEIESVIRFKDKHFEIDFASGEEHQIGLNVWSFILDEANFHSGVGNGTEEQYASVTALYEQLIDRQISRFARPDGTVDALAILISSASYQSSFLEKRKAAIKGNPNAICITSTAYDVRPERFSKEKFEVFIGTGVVEPCIIESEEHKLKILQTAGILGTGEEDTFIKKVPINLRSSFDTNIARALQNHCGVPTMMSSSFMSNLKFLYSSYTDEILPILQSFELEASTADDTQLIEYLIKGNIRYAERPHSMFLDLSVQHDTGCLCCFRYDGKDERGYDIHTRVFSLRIKPAKYPHQTDIRKVRNFVEDIAQYLNIVAFASDQYQSTQLRQEVNEDLGLEDVRISIDSSDIPHMHWQRGLVEGRIRQTADSVLEREVKEAIHDWKRHRVVKATKSSDDVMQANVGAFFLSDTEGKSGGTLEGLYGPRVNLVGGKSIETVLRSCGYIQS